MQYILAVRIEYIRLQYTLLMLQLLRNCSMQYSALLVGDSGVAEESKATGVSSSVSRGGSRRLRRRVEEENDWNETSC
jgi:hypothetical protein